MKINRHFARHYGEMVIAMFAGMVILGLPAEAALRAAGSSMSDVHENAPAAMLLGMGVAMTLPMVAWMRYRGHAWRPSNEMAASMMIPTFATMGLLWSGALTDFGVLFTLLHVVMFPSMLVAMLLRREEYSGAHHAHGAAALRSAA